MVPNLTPEKLEIFVGVSKFAAVSIMREKRKRREGERRGRKMERKEEWSCGGTFVPRMENR